MSNMTPVETRDHREDGRSGCVFLIALGLNRRPATSGSRRRWNSRACATRPVTIRRRALAARRLRS